MILSDADIRARLARGDLKVGPLEDERLQILEAHLGGAQRADGEGYRVFHGRHRSARVYTTFSGLFPRPAGLG